MVPPIPRSSATSSPATACGWAASRSPSARRWTSSKALTASWSCRPLNLSRPVTPAVIALSASAPCRAAATSLPARAVHWMPWARPCCGTWNPARSSSPTPRPVSCAPSKTTAAVPTARCASSSSSTSPAPTASSRAARCMRPASRQAASWLRSTPWRPMWSSVCRTPASTPPLATLRRAASPTASALLKISTSAAPSSRAARSSARTASASS